MSCKLPAGEIVCLGEWKFCCPVRKLTHYHNVG
jgi:hypothetical protein